MLSEKVQRSIRNLSQKLGPKGKRYIIFCRFKAIAFPVYLDSSDIIDHGILEWLKCSLVPEKSCISHKNENYFTMKMTAPYNCQLETFLEHLQKCCLADEFKSYNFICEIIYEDKNLIELQIPYSLLDETQVSAIEKYIDLRYKNSRLHQYYNYSNATGWNIAINLIDDIIDSYLNTSSSYYYFFKLKTIFGKLLVNL